LAICIVEVGTGDAAGSQAWAYDKMGRPITDQRTTNSVTKSTLYTYNLDGSIATLTYPGGRIITYQPSGAGRTLWAKDLANSINYVTGTCGPTSDGVCYAPQGAPTSLQNGASIISTLYYNSRLQPCRISVKSSGTAPTQCSDTTNIGNVLDFSYNFSVGTADNGNVSSITNNRDANRMQNFTYDSMNRIATAYTSGSLWGETFQIDQWGNLNKILPYARKPQPENLNQMAGNNNRFTGMSYDAAGNLLNDGASTYLYDAENRIQTGAGVTYTYDGDGKRVQKSNGKLYWYGMGSDPLDESDASGNLTDEYVFFGGKRITRRNVSSGNIFYYFADHLGTSRVILQASQTIPCYDADFYPFGGERVVTNTCTQNYKFTGKERDSESGLDNFEARYYASSLGRFVQPDEFTGGPLDLFGQQDPPGPLPYADIWNPQSLNKYSHTYNNPLRYVDRNGHCVEDLCIGEALLVATAVTVTVNYLNSPQGKQNIAVTVQGLSAGLQTIANFFSKSHDAEAGELSRDAKDAAKQAGEAIGELEAAVAGEKANSKDQQEANNRIADQKAGVDALNRAKDAVGKATGKEARDAAKAELKKQIDLAKQHTKAIQQLVKRIVKTNPRTD
jgi:RHS repeat-associated protein